MPPRPRAMSAEVLADGSVRYGRGPEEPHRHHQEPVPSG